MEHCRCYHPPFDYRRFSHAVAAASGPRSPWSMGEMAVLRANPTLALDSLSALLPGRSIKSIAVARWRTLASKRRTRNAPK